MRPIAIIGYSGHAYVVIDIFHKNHRKVLAYCEPEAVPRNRFDLMYLGDHQNPQTQEKLRDYDFFIAIGDNLIRRKVAESLHSILPPPLNVIHPSAILAESIILFQGIMLGASAVVNPAVELNNGVICNTGSIIEHGCKIGQYAHIAPGAVLCGDVEVGENAFIGAGAVIKQGLKIGKNAIVGAGAVVIRDIPEGAKVVGNPAKIISL
jgi:sugar O-acyltransferase (sialic acid O-acetyltransferase NeuD family)